MYQFDQPVNYPGAFLGARTPGPPPQQFQPSPRPPMMQQQQFVQSLMPPNPNQFAHQMGGMQLHKGVKSLMPRGSFPVNRCISPSRGTSSRGLR